MVQSLWFHRLSSVACIYGTGGWGARGPRFKFGTGHFDFCSSLSSFIHPSHIMWPSLHKAWVTQLAKWFMGSPVILLWAKPFSYLFSPLLDGVVFFAVPLAMARSSLAWFTLYTKKKRNLEHIWYQNWSKIIKFCFKKIIITMDRSSLVWITLYTKKKKKSWTYLISELK